MTEKIHGRWRIVESEAWDRDALDLVGEAEIVFDANGRGSLAMIAVSATFEYQVKFSRGRPDRVQLTFDGFDEMDPISGTIKAQILGDTLVGKLFFHQGDESSFRAARSEVRPDGV